MGAPQIMFIVLLCLEFLVHALKHGEIRPDIECKYHVGRDLVSSAITVGLLIWGGFFKC